METLKQINGFSDYYITQNGQIVCWKKGWRFIMTQSRQYRYGRLGEKCVASMYVTLRDKQGNGFKRSVHVLVLEAFDSLRPEGYQARHLDGNPENNHIDNLCWGTATENQRDRIRHGTSNRGEAHGLSYLSEQAIQDIRSSQGIVSQKELANKHNTTQPNISQIQSGKTWDWL